jgi:DNA-binding CsgD family transcriptional regulator
MAHKIETGGQSFHPAWEEIGGSLNLSHQELRIVRGVFDDLTESAIADELQISPHTVHTHLGRLYRKLGVTGRVPLVLRVMEKYVALARSAEHLPPALFAGFYRRHKFEPGNRV